MSLRFSTSLTVKPSDVLKMKRFLAESGTHLRPLDNVLTTPLFGSRDTIKLLAQLAEEGAHVTLDSAGYYVQTGRLRYEELYMPLLEVYRNNPWASLYTLPDHVPLSSDSDEAVAHKVQSTIRYSRLFFQEMPDDLKSRAMPVVHGRTFKHVDQCLAAYLELGVNWIGFGSFGTMGVRSQMNIATQGAVELAEYVIKVAHHHGIKVHLFGLGAPPLVAMLKGIGADSFDSASWLVAAGFGMVSLPFWRFYNITHRSTIAELQQGVKFEEFEHWRELTGHRCRLCENLLELQQYKMHRAAHNLICLCESVEMVNSGNYARVSQIYASGSVKYRQESDKWLKTLDPQFI